MEEEERDSESIRQGYQAKTEKFGYQPSDSTIEKGYQPKAVETKPEGERPPSGGSNVKPPPK